MNETYILKTKLVDFRIPTKRTVNDVTEFPTKSSRKLPWIRQTTKA